MKIPGKKGLSRGLSVRRRASFHFQKTITSEVASGTVYSARYTAEPSEVRIQSQRGSLKCASGASRLCSSPEKLSFVTLNKRRGFFRYIGIINPFAGRFLLRSCSPEGPRRLIIEPREKDSSCHGISTVPLRTCTSTEEKMLRDFKTPAEFRRLLHSLLYCP